VKRPCGSCPYRKDVPSGVWSAEEYEKLPAYDDPTNYQSFSAFFCHQQDGSLCSGWVGCHDMDESIGLRLAVAHNLLTKEQYEEALDYVCPVPLWESGQVARDHGMAELIEPGDKAKQVVAKLGRKLGLEYK
jgi:hypothetical protein